MNKLTKNYFYTGCYQALGIIIPLITTPYLTRCLGSTYLGIDTFVLSIVQLCEVFGSLGTTIYANREIAYARDNKQKLVETFWELLFLRLSLGLLTCIVYGAISFCLNYHMVFAIQSIALISYFFDTSWFYIGIEDVRPIALASAFVKICSAIIIFTCVKSSADFYIYLLTGVLSQAIIMIILLCGCRKRGIFFVAKNVSVKKHIGPVLALFLPQAASSLYVMFDKTMLGMLGSDVSRTSIYDKAEILVKAPTIVFATALTTVLMPRIANEFSNRRMDNVKDLVQQSMDMMLLIFVPICVGLAIVAPIFVPFYLGNGYVDSVKVIWVLSTIVVAIGISNVTGAQFLIGCNETRWLTASYLTSAVFNIVGNYFLIPRLDEIGAALTTMAAEWIVVMIQLYAVRKRIGPLGMARNGFKKILAAGIMALAIIPMARLQLGIVTVLIQVLAGAVVYFLVLYVTKDAGIKRVFSLVRGFRR